jgi:hypothetical protein
MKKVEEGREEEEDKDERGSRKKAIQQGDTFRNDGVFQNTKRDAFGPSLELRDIGP